MPANADVVALQMEKVRKKLPDLFETSSVASGMIKKGGEAERVSTRDYRIPLVLQNGGVYGTYDPDGGDMGRGTAMKTVPMISTYFPTSIAFEITELMQRATDSSEIAVAKAFARLMTKAIEEFQTYEDYSFHTDGSGVIATATAQATVSSKTVYTLDTNFSTQLIRPGGSYHVYDTTLGTQRTVAGTPLTATIVDPAAGKVTLSATVSGAAATDKLLPAGVSGATPAWKKGLYYYHSATASGNLLQISKATYPELVTPHVDGASGPLSAAHGLLLLDQIVQRRDDLGSLVGLAHMKQRTAWYLLGMQISEWQRGKSDDMLDLVPDTGDGLKKFRFCGVDHLVDKHQNRTRIDWINKKNWGRAVLADMDYYTVGDKKLFEIRGSSGGVASAIVFYLRTLEDWYCVDPGAAGYIDALALPAV